MHVRAIQAVAVLVAVVFMREWLPIIWMDWNEIYGHRVMEDVVAAVVEAVRLVLNVVATVSQYIFYLI